MLGVDRMSLEEVQRVEWGVLNGKMKKWTQAFKVVVQGLLAEERRICNQIFAADAATEEECFTEAAKGCVLQLLRFADAIATVKRSPEKLFRILHMYEALAELLSGLEALFSGEARDCIKKEAERILVGLGDAVRDTVAEFANAIQGESSRRTLPGGEIHPLARYVMNYIDDKSKLYHDEALQNIFLMNNLWHIVQKVNGSELKTLLGDIWIRKHSGQIRAYSKGYLRSSWNRVLDCVRDDGLPHTMGSSSALKDAVKERFRNFNRSFEELYRTQTAWKVVDPQLREELKFSISVNVLAAYRPFVGMFGDQLKGRDYRKYVKYSSKDLENKVSDFFEGRSVTTGFQIKKIIRNQP
ncbi:RGA2a [Hordeum vulgare]|nr:RGA2a [Hordeum vulgare]